MPDNSFLFVSLIASQKLLKAETAFLAPEGTGAAASSEFCRHEVNVWLHKGEQRQAALEFSHVMNHLRLWQGWRFGKVYIILRGELSNHRTRIHFPGKNVDGYFMSPWCVHSQHFLVEFDDIVLAECL